MIITGTEVVFICVTGSQPMATTPKSAKNSHYICENRKKWYENELLVLQ